MRDSNDRRQITINGKYYLEHVCERDPEWEVFGGKIWFNASNLVLLLI